MKGARVQQTNLMVALDVRSELARNNILAVLGSCAVTLRVIGADSPWEDVSSLASLRSHHAVYFTDVIDKAYLDSLASIGFRRLDRVLLVREDTKNAVQDNTCGPLTSLGWCAVQMDVKDSMLSQS